MDRQRETAGWHFEDQWRADARTMVRTWMGGEKNVRGRQKQCARAAERMCTSDEGGWRVRGGM